MTEVIPINLGLVYAYLVKGERKSVLVDCGFPGQERRITRALEKNGIGKGDLSLIVITHGDIDHYGSSGRLRELLAVPVLVHEADSNIIRTGTNRKIRSSGLSGYLMKCLALLLTALTRHRYRPYEPDVIMQTDRLSLNAYGLEGYLLHTPGETQGSLSLVLPGRQVIAGDLIGAILPHTAVPAYSPFPGDRGEVRKSLARVLSLDPAVIYTGHSRPIDVNKHRRRLSRLAC